MIVLWCLIEKVVFKFGFEKGVSLTKFNFYIKLSMEISGKGLFHRVPTSTGKPGKPGKSQKKVPCMEKSWNLKKTEKSWKNHGIL